MKYLSPKGVTREINKYQGLASENGKCFDCWTTGVLLKSCAGFPHVTLPIFEEYVIHWNVKHRE